MKIKITRPEFLAAASLMVSKDPERYYAGGVHIEPAPSGGVFLVATNGTCLVVFHDEEGAVDGECTLKVSRGLFWASKQSKAGSNRMCLIVENDILQIIDAEVGELYIERFAPIDGKFVDWRKVVPSLPHDGSDFKVFDAKLMAQFAKVNEIAYGKKQAASIYMSCSSPIIVTPTPTKEWFGILMPFQAHPTGQRIPFEIGGAK